MTGLTSTVERVGGGAGWGLMLAGLSHFALELCHNFLPVLYPLLVVQMDLTYAQIGVIALIVGLITSVPQPFLGFLSDRFGPYRVGALSILWLGGLMGLVGFAPNYLIFTALIGFGIGNTYPTFVLMAQDCWPQRAAVASGLIMGIGWAPGGLGASVTGYLADRSTLGASLTWLVVPPVMGLLCLVVWRWFVRSAATFEQ